MGRAAFLTALLGGFLGGGRYLLLFFLLIVLFVLVGYSSLFLFGLHALFCCVIAFAGSIVTSLGVGALGESVAVCVGATVAKVEDGLGIDVTAINEYTLFPSKNNCDSESLRGNDNAVPISVNLLHERNGHSKKDKKNKRNSTPLFFYKEKEIVKANKNYQKIDQLTNIKKGEAGRLVEYFIRYKNDNLISELLNNHIFGNIMYNVKLFTSNNFEELANIIKNKKSTKSFSFFGLFSNEKVNKNEVQKDPRNNDEDDEKQNTEKEEEPPKESLEYYEKYYLFPGKIFVYPYSIPVDYISPNEEEKDISEGRRRYLEKYKDAIIQGRKRHYGED